MERNYKSGTIAPSDFRPYPKVAWGLFMQRPFQKLVRRIARRLCRRQRHPRVTSRALFVGDRAALGLTEPADLVKASNVQEALVRLNHEEIPVVLCDQDVSKDWKTTVRQLASSRSRPSVVVLSAGKPLSPWQEITAAGGYDIVQKPTPPGLLDHVIGSATIYWRCRQALDSARRSPTAKK
jgi:CheY-like chemotaxis protein